MVWTGAAANAARSLMAGAARRRKAKNTEERSNRRAAKGSTPRRLEDFDYGPQPTRGRRPSRRGPARPVQGRPTRRVARRGY